MKPETKSIAFVVHGKHATQGSKTPAAKYGRDGSPIMKNGRVVTFVRESSKNHKTYRQEIANAAWCAMKEREHEPFLGPVALAVLIVRQRPKSHYRTGKHAGELKPNVPNFVETTPDTLKVVRAVEDAMKGIVYRDDSQVAFHTMMKVYGDHDYTRVYIFTLDSLDVAALTHAVLILACKEVLAKQTPKGELSCQK